MLTQAQKDRIGTIQQSNVFFEEPMSRHTSFQIGGPAEVLIEPESEERFSALIRYFRAEGIPFVVIGAGSNLLVADRGIRGAVIKTGKALEFLRCEGNRIQAGCGVSLAKLAQFAAKNCLSGLEFASGIPGLVGGALVMNAGAYGGEMKDVVVRSCYLDENGEKQIVEGDAHAFCYRGSCFSGGGKYILSAEFELKKAEETAIRETMRELNSRRREKQPLNFPSAGSTFKRPEGYFAAKLIEDAGLKGATVGGAAVSEKHAGFVINQSGSATAEDVLNLIGRIKETVLEKFGVELCCEVKLLGDF